MKIIEKDLTFYFPTIRTVDRLGTLCGVSGEFKPFFYDIETTGLARKTTNLYLIGVVFPDGERWVMRQWFAEGPEEEEAILEKFAEFSKAFSHTVQFNGNKFDAPYIRERCSVYGLESPLDSVPGLDLYQFLKPIRLLLQLDHMRQADV
ncbi:MAG: ribonuclease H-like domain-containing protein, partial [Clostridiales bacterium]|nr:ribonuclease H-like domain-containing protein [Candidatus Blautia equi]